MITKSLLESVLNEEHLMYDFLKENAKSIITPVIISNSDEFVALNGVESGNAVAGETLVLDVQKK